MTTEDQSSSIVDGSNTEEAVSNQQETTDVSPEILAKAEKMGWTPKEQFRGDPEKWRPADEYVERGEQVLPILKAHNRRIEKELAEVKNTLKEFGEYHTQTEKRAYEKALTELKEQRAKAVADGDGAMFTKVDEAIEKIKDDLQEKSKRVAKDDYDPVFDEWKERNSWLNDPKMEAYGNSMAQYLRETKGITVVGAEFLELVTKEVKEAFPHKFENPKRNAAVSVETGSPPRKGGKSFADMSAESRSACERMAKAAYLDNPKEAQRFKDNFVKQYFEGGA